MSVLAFAPTPTWYLLLGAALVVGAAALCGLVAALLAAPADSLGPHFRLLLDYNYGGPDGIPLARLYEIVP